MLGACALEVRAQTVPQLQYFWAAPDRVYLWRTPDSQQPVVATLRSPATSNWEVQPPGAVEEWRPMLQTIVQHYKEKAKLDAVTDQLLWDFMLTKLSNEPLTTMWAKPRRPVAEMYVLRKDAGVDVIFVWSDAGTTKVNSFPFKLQGAAWKQSFREYIPVETFLKLPPFSPELHKILDIPDSEAIPQKDWSAAWDRWLKTTLEGEKARPVTYLDKDKAPQWLWRERLAPEEPLPKGFKDVARKTTPLNEPFIPEAEGPTQAKTWREWPYIGVVIVVSAVVIGLLLWLIMHLLGGWRPRLPKLSLGFLRRWRRTPPANPLVSPEGLDVLYDFLGTQYKPTGDALADIDRQLHIELLVWSRERSKLALADKGFQQVSGDLKKKIVEDYQRELGVEQEADRAKFGEWVTLGRALAQNKAEFERAQQLTYVREALDGLGNGQKAEQLGTLADVLPHLPGLLTRMDERLVNLGQEHTTLQATHQALKDSLDAERVKIQADAEKRWQSQVTKLAGDLKTKTDAHQDAVTKAQTDGQTIGDLTTQVANLKRDLKAAQDQGTNADTQRGVFEKRVNAIKDVQQLSRYLRQWIQSYYDKQAHAREGDTRHVALLATLVNYSMYQLCFSIADDEKELRKALANNLHRCMERINTPNNYQAALDILKRIDPKAETALEELRHVGGGTLDDRLIQSFLSTLKADSGLILSPFFIDLDPKQNRITLANAS